MADTVFPFQVVLFTENYSITGGVFLREQRLSDFLNDRRDTFILMRNVSMARIEKPGKILESTSTSIVLKNGILLAFEPPQKTPTLPRSYIKYPKRKYDVFVALEGLQVRGKLNQAGPLDLRQAIASTPESFIPITEAIVTIDANPALVIKRDTVLVNVQRIRFIGAVEPPPAASEDKP